MLDQSKPRLGSFAACALARWAEAYASAPRQWYRATYCDLYHSDLDVPIYRRFDTPDSFANRALTRWARMYPNEGQPIDRGLYLIVIRDHETAAAVIAFHACHPVSRANPMEVSADFVGAIRDGVRKRFGNVPCLFLQGASGDVRPNVARKRVKWLPKSRLNWRFEYRVSLSEQQAIDNKYRDAVQAATRQIAIPLADEAAIDLSEVTLPMHHYGAITFHRLRVGGRLTFDFVPFEVSHHFQRSLSLKDSMHFIVGCAQQTRGYLPHPTQLRAGGYEVDGSRKFMGLPHRVEIQGPSPW